MEGRCGKQQLMEAFKKQYDDDLEGDLMKEERTKDGSSSCNWGVKI